MHEVCTFDVMRDELIGRTDDPLIKRMLTLTQEAASSISRTVISSCGTTFSLEGSAVMEASRPFRRTTPVPSPYFTMVCGYEVVDAEMLGDPQLHVLRPTELQALRSHIDDAAPPALRSAWLQILRSTSIYANKFDRCRIGCSVVVSKAASSRHSHNPCCVAVKLARAEVVRVDGVDGIPAGADSIRYGEVQYFISADLPLANQQSAQLLLAYVMWRHPRGQAGDSSVRKVSRAFFPTNSGYHNFVPVSRLVSSCSFVPDIDEQSSCDIVVKYHPF